MATGTPEQRQQEAQRDLTSLELPKAQFRELMNKQRSMQKDVESQTHLRSVLSYPNVQAIMHDAGVRSGTKKFDEFSGYMEDRLEQWKKDNPGKSRATEAEAAQLAGQLTRKITTPGRLFGTNEVRAFQDTPPAKFVETATKLYKDKNGRDLTPGELQRYWVNEVASGRRDDPRWK
jgi:hypothetical protein